MRMLLRLLRALGPVRTSNLCGGVVRAIGPLLPVSRVAHGNLRAVLPELDAAQRRGIVRGVWENLGRTVGEFANLASLRESSAGPGWETEGEEHIRFLIQGSGPAIMFTGHIGNWEVLPAAVAGKGVRFAMMYRAFNDPVINDVILELRRAAVGAEAKLFAKGAQGARLALAHLQAGGNLGLLQDQKMNDGIESRFFGLPAMTAPALATLALRMQCPVLPAYARRLGPARFRVVFEAPIPLPDTGDRATDVAALTQAVNDRLEGWSARGRKAGCGCTGVGRKTRRGSGHGAPHHAPQRLVLRGSRQLGTGEAVRRVLAGRDWAFLGGRHPAALFNSRFLRVPRAL